MKNLFARGLSALPCALLMLSASFWLTGYWEKDIDGSYTSRGGACNTAAVVVEPSKTTGATG